MACSGQIFNRKVGLVLIALSIYGLLLVFVSNDSISPKFLIANFKNRYMAVFDMGQSNITELQKENLTDEVVVKHIKSTLPKMLYVNSSLRDTLHDNNRTLSHTPKLQTLNITIGIQGTLNQTNGTNRTAPKNDFTMHWIKTTLKNLQSNSSRNATKGGPSFTTSAGGLTAVPLDEGKASKNDTPLITLFTTFRNSPEKTHIYKNTIRNWNLLSPWVKPILYTISGELDMTAFAKEHGWDVLPVPKTSRAGVPILRHMFLDAQEKYSSTYYGYVNGDILFTEGLVNTLKAMLPSLSNMKQVLIVGRRTNFQLQPKQNITTLHEVTEFGKRGTLFSTNAQDYFISTRNGYPWKTIPDFVVGRVGYDNWLVVTALVKRMYTIDTTKTVLALHQTGTDGNFAGHRKKPKGDTYINYGLAGSKFDYSLGHVSCGQFFTEGKKEDIKIVQRNKNGCERTFKKYRVSPYMSLKPPSRSLL